MSRFKRRGQADSNGPRPSACIENTAATRIWPSVHQRRLFGDQSIFVLQRLIVTNNIRANALPAG
ncbi:MAG: hypothetical protein ACPGPS_12780, partial [Rubripirellula sp.]